MQNINIVYKVDKSEVEKSNQAVQQAKKLTDDLKKSSQQYTDQATKGNKAVASSHEAMKVKLAQLRQQIDLTNKADTKRLNDLIRQYKQAKEEVDRFNKSLKEQHDASLKATQGTNNLAGGFTNMYNAMRLIIGAAMVRELVDITLEAAKLAGQVETVGRAFSNQIPNSEALLFRLRKATHGTVTDLELMQRALKFQNFGADVERLPELLEFAAVRAQQTGESIDYMVNSIVDGIGRKSILKLDNLGISATRLKDEFNGVALASLSVAEVTQGVANIMQEELQKMGGYAETSATKVEQITVALEDLKVELAKKPDANWLLDFFNDILIGSKKIVQALPPIFELKNLIPGYNVITFLQDFRKNLADVVKQEEGNRLALEEFTEWQKKANKEGEKALQLAQLQIVAGVERMNANEREIKSWEKKIELLKEDAFANKDMIEQGQQAILYYEGQQVKLGKLNQLYAEYILNLQKVKDGQEGELETLKVLNDRLDALRKKREETIWVGDQKTLDALQREINLLEDRILKIDDNVEWQERWKKGTDNNIVAEQELTETLEAQKKAFEDLEKAGMHKLREDRGPGEKVDFSNLDEGADKIKQLGYEINQLEKQLDKVVSEKLTNKIKNQIKNKLQQIQNLQEQLDFQVEINPTVKTSGEAWARFKIGLKEAFKGAENELITGGIDLTANLAAATMDLELASYNARLNQLQDFYNEQQELAGDNERYKKELAIREQRDRLKIEKEMAQKQKQARMNMILIDTAASVAKTAATLGFPAAIPFILLATAQGAAQYAIASRQPTGYKEGVLNLNGPGTSTSDSIPARLSKGESVMTAKETKGSINTLKMIRAKQLDDKVIARLAIKAKGGDTNIMDDSRIVEASKRIEQAVKGTDIVRKGSLIYEAKKESETFTKYTRSKIIHGWD